MEDPRESRSSIPLVSRLDRLDFIMKYLEGKQNLSKCSSNIRGIERQSVPLDLAVREAYFKGSLMDRVAFLERRLLQLGLELESSSASGTSSQTSGYASSSQGSKSEPSSSSLTSNFPNQVHTQHSHIQADYKPQPKETFLKEEEARKNSKPKKQKLGKNQPTAQEKTCKSGRKRASPRWPHLKILGC
ncbi:conserved hypothetical protein [Ricinus communis]|uniref:Uncharacterized protein n=1 Tax=Ricinus communis TaxID=3988 RepID=B9S1F5_RICCO|nr:conserved hypothetical protein [Ricinus communis]|eukprot:XP_002519820.1 uncharacterized protein LOC8284602 [Ricinus communis]